jgi:hypothetical protein
MAGLGLSSKESFLDFSNADGIDIIFLYFFGFF